MKQRFPADTRLALEEITGVAVALCLATTLALVALTLFSPSDAERNRCNAACVEARG